MEFDKKFLVVCEGPSDFPIIDGIIQSVAKSRNKKFKVQLLEPQVDATTAKADPFGWTEVRRWCQTYSIKSDHDISHLPEAIRDSLKRKNWEALIAISNADFLLIHMDTDIAEKLENLFDVTKTTRKEHCEQHLNRWLGITTSKPNCRYVLPTYAIETWLLATYDNVTSPGVFPVPVADYETINDVEAKLISLGYARNGSKLKKSLKRYRDNEKYLPRLLASIEKSKMRCSELSNFTGFLGAV